MNLVEWHALLILFSPLSLYMCFSDFYILLAAEFKPLEKMTSLCVSSLSLENISLQQTLYLNSFPITPRALTQNYLRSILYLPEQTKAWECFQSQRGEASRVD